MKTTYYKDIRDEHYLYRKEEPISFEGATRWSVARDDGPDIWTYRHWGVNVDYIIPLTDKELFLLHI